MFANDRSEEQYLVNNTEIIAHFVFINFNYPLTRNNMWICGISLPWI